MANIKTRAVTRSELMQITDALKNGFIMPDGTRVRSNDRISSALILMANLGVRVGDLLKLRLCDVIQEGGPKRRLYLHAELCATQGTAPNRQVV